MGSRVRSRRRSARMMHVARRVARADLRDRPHSRVMMPMATWNPTDGCGGFPVSARRGRRRLGSTRVAIVDGVGASAETCGPAWDSGSDDGGSTGSDDAGGEDDDDGGGEDDWQRRNRWVRTARVMTGNAPVERTLARDGGERWTNRVTAPPQGQRVTSSGDSGFGPEQECGSSLVASAPFARTRTDRWHRLVLLIFGLGWASGGEADDQRSYCPISALPA